MGIDVNMNPDAFSEMLGIATEVCIVDFSEVMESYVVQESPYQYGHNRRSVRREPRIPQAGDKIVHILTESGYGGYLEIGTEKMPAQPYFSVAFNRARADFGIL